MDMVMAEVSLRDLDTAQVFNLIRKDNPMAFGERIPPATLGTLEKTFQNLSTHQAGWNSFVSTLINRIGLTLFAEKKAFSNPLAEFKSDRLAYGNVVQEIATGLLRAHTYDTKDDGETVWSREVPNTKAIYHELNRQNYYKVTINRDQLAQAFMSETGLVQYVDQLMGALSTSDNLDEYLLMINLMRQYHEAGGFFYQKGGMASITNDGDRAKDLLRKMRAAGENMAYPNTRFNAGNMPTWADPSELVVFTTPTMKSFIDVDALAAAFNMERMNINSRIVTIPDQMWPLPGVNTIVTTRDFFKVFDNLLTFTDITNPQSLNINSFLHHWQIISCSIFAPAVAFTDELETIMVEAEPADVTIDEVEAIHIYPRNAQNPIDSVARGGELAFDANLTVTGDGTYNTAIAWEVRSNNSVNTVIDNTGTLTVASNETAATLTVRAYMARDTTVGAETTISVVGDVEPTMIDNTVNSAPSFDRQSPPKTGKKDTEYAGYQFGVVGGNDANVVFTATGALPAGITLTAAGVLAGTPTTAGAKTFTVTATNDHGTDTTPDITITITA